MKDKYFGARLKALRKRLDLTQTVAAQKVGIGYKALQDHEGGGRPNRNNLKKYLNFYGCDEAWLLFGSGEPFPGKSDEGIFVKEPAVPYNALEREGEKRGAETLGTGPPGGNIHEQFKLSEALTAAARVLESRTSYAMILYLNIQHFDRAIQAETRINQLEQNNERLEKRMFNLEKKLRETDVSKICTDESCERRAA